MAFQVSPGVNTSEIDLTNVVVAAATSTGGFAGRFRWGPIEEVTLVTDEDNLKNQFYKPNDDNAVHWITAANFLSYTNALNLVRAANTTTGNAAAPHNAAANTAAYANLQITDSEAYYTTYDPEQGGTIGGGVTNVGNDGPFMTKWAGDIGNTFKVSICPADRPASDGNLSGTVAWTESTGALVGASSPKFQDELRVGDLIKITGETGNHLITTVTDASNAVAVALDSSDDANVTATTATRLKRSAFSTPSSHMKGTVSVTADSTTVTGSGTLFDIQMNVGDTIVINGESKRVKTITNNTSITTSDSFLATAATQSYAREWEYKGSVNEGAPTTSDYADNKNMSLDQIHVVVADEDGEWSGTIGEVIEAHANLSVASGARDDQGDSEVR